MIPQFEPEKNYQKTTEGYATVRFQDCDPLGHLNNARYFDYFLNSRADEIQKIYNFDTLDIFKQFGASWVIYNHNISFIRPAMMGEKVKIHSRIVFIDKYTIIIEFFMTNEAGTDLKNLLWSNMKFVDGKTGKLTEHPLELTTYLSAILYPVDINEGVQQRIKMLKIELMRSQQSL